VALVLSLNLSRRHLTPSQRAAAVVACATWREIGNNQYSSGSAPGADPDANVSARELAKQADVSTRTIERAKQAQRAGLGEVVRDGGMSAKAAAALAGEAPPVRALRREQPEEEDGSAAQLLEEIVTELTADLEAAERVLAEDDKLAAAWSELKTLRAKHAELEALYSQQRVELAAMTSEAARWKRTAGELRAKAKT
jgi:DNA-binding transcriptional regulator YhcF (GntR family)